MNMENKSLDHPKRRKVPAQSPTTFFPHEDASTNISIATINVWNFSEDWKKRFSIISQLVNRLYYFK